MHIAIVGRYVPRTSSAQTDASQLHLYLLLDTHPNLTRVLHAQFLLSKIGIKLGHKTKINILKNVSGVLQPVSALSTMHIPPRWAHQCCSLA